MIAGFGSSRGMGRGWRPKVGAELVARGLLERAVGGHGLLKGSPAYACFQGESSQIVPQFSQ
jgi:hypothetical protein